MVYIFSSTSSGEFQHAARVKSQIDEMGRKRNVRKRDKSVGDMEEAAGTSNDGWKRNGVSTGDLLQNVGSRKRSWWWFIGCAVILAIATVTAITTGLVSFNYPSVPPVHLMADDQVKEFETFLEELASTSHEDTMKAVVRVPVVFHETRFRLDNAIRTILRSDLSGEEWQDLVVRDTKQISHLFRETAEEMFDYLLRGRSIMKYMADLGLPSIAKAFKAGDYAIVLQVLEYMERHIKDAEGTITTAKGKMSDGIGRAENVLESVRKKIHALSKDAKEADKGWSTETKLAVYGLAMTLTIVTGAIAVPFVGVGAGLTAAGGTATISGGAAITKHWLDIADGEELKQQLQFDAHNLEGAYDDMSVVRDNLEQVSMHIRKLRIAVDDAEKSMSGLYGQLKPEKATNFYHRLNELAHRCSELHTLYERGIADYHKEDWQQQQDPQAIDQQL